MLLSGCLSVALAHGIRQLPTWEKSWQDFGGQVHDVFSKPPPPDLADGFRAHVKSIIDITKRLKDEGLDDATIRMKLKRMFPNMEDMDFDKTLEIALNMWKNKWAAFYEAIHDPPPMPGTGAAAQMQLAAELVGGKYTDAAFKKHFKLVQKMRDEAAKAPTNFALWTKYYAALRDLRNKSTQDQQQAMAMVGTMTDQAVLKALRNVEKLKQAAEAAPTDLSKWKAWIAAREALDAKATASQMEAARAVVDAQPEFSMKSGAVLEAVQNLERLKQVAETAPNLAAAMAAWEAYYAAQEDLSKKASSTMIQAAQAAVDALEDIAPKISNEALAGMIRQAEAMREQLEKAPSPQGYIEYYALLDRITKLSTDNQRQAIEEYVRAQNALIDQAKDKLKELTSALVSMYQEIRTENQNLFGALLEGPYIDRLSENVDKITDAADRKIDRLQDQIEKLRKVGEDIDAATGNLIDWGLLPKPEVDKKEIERIEKEIDRIRKNAQEAAEKERKRIQEKRFTPKEIQKDLQMQMNQFLRFQKVLEGLRKRGAPLELIEQLKALGPAGLPALEAIMKMNPEQWAKYIGTFKKAQKLIDKQSQKDLKNELKRYKERGVLVAQAIIDGVTSQDAKLQASIERLIVKMFPEMAGRVKAAQKAREAATGKKPPPKGTVPKKAPKPPPKGTIPKRAPVVPKKPPVAKKPPARRPAPAPVKPKKPAATQATHVTFNYHYHNEGGKGMGADTFGSVGKVSVIELRTKVC